MFVTVRFDTPVALAVLSTTLSLNVDLLVFFSSSKNRRTFSIMYFVCEVRRIPLPGFLATFCATVDSEVDGIEDLVDGIEDLDYVNIIAVYNIILFL